MNNHLETNLQLSNTQFIIFATEDEIKTQKEYIIKSEQLIWQEKTFIKGPSLSVNLSDRAKQFCEEYTNKNHLFIIVKGQFHLTVWIEQTSSYAANQEPVLEAKSDSKKLSDAQTQKMGQPSVASKARKQKQREKVYRGVVYSEGTTKETTKTENPIKVKLNHFLSQAGQFTKLNFHNNL